VSELAAADPPAPLPGPGAPEALTIQLTPGAADVLRGMFASGLWGHTLEEAAERLLCERLRDEMINLAQD
jgi:hypothetical protein